MPKPAAAIIVLLLTMAFLRLSVPTYANSAVPQRPESATLNTTLTLNPVADAYVSSRHPSWNYGSSAWLHIDSSPVEKSYLRFNVTGVGGTVTKATLLIYANSSLGSGYNVRPVSNNAWSESTLTYSNAPAMGSVIGSSGAVNAGAWTSVDITGHVVGNGAVSFGITDPSTTALNLASRESANKPHLLLTISSTTPTATRTPLPATPTATRTATASAVPPTATRTATASPAAPTPTRTSTASSLPPTPTRTATAVTVPPTVTPTPLNTGTGKVYYVSTTGNDTSGNGSATSPWRTIARGVSVLNPGDTLYLRSGTYLQTSTLSISRSGTANARITISTAPGEASLAVISGDTNGNRIADTTDTPGPSGYHLVVVDGSYLNLENLEIAYSGKHGLTNYGANNLIAHNRIHDIWRAGVWTRAANTVIEYNTIYRAADSNYCGGVGGSRGCNGNWDGALAWGDTSAPYNKAPNTIVRHNTVYHNSGEGLLGMQTDGALVEDNVAYDNWALNIDLDQCSYTTVRRNLAYYTGDTSWWQGGSYPATNIMLSDEGNGGYTVVAHDNTVVNNILIGGGESLRFWRDGTTMPNASLVNYLIANNTIVNDQGGHAPLYIGPSGTHINTRITNNIVVQTAGSYMAYVASATGLTFDHNLWSQTPPSNVSSSTNVIGNPLLADPGHVRSPGSVLPSWYDLTLNSPAIDAGATLSGVTPDFAGVLRPRGAADDIGAFEY